MMMSDVETFGPSFSLYIAKNDDESFAITKILIIALVHGYTPPTCIRQSQYLAQWNFGKCMGIL